MLDISLILRYFCMCLAAQMLRPLASDPRSRPLTQPPATSPLPEPQAINQPPSQATAMHHQDRRPLLEGTNSLTAWPNRPDKQASNQQPANKGSNQASKQTDRHRNTIHPRDHVSSVTILYHPTSTSITTPSVGLDIGWDPSQSLHNSSHKRKSSQPSGVAGDDKGVSWERVAMMVLWTASRYANSSAWDEERVPKD